MLDVIWVGNCISSLTILPLKEGFGQTQNFFSNA